VADNWFDTASRKAAGASEEYLRATTLAAQVSAQPRTRTYVVSLDSGPAGLFAGAFDSNLFWMDDGGRFNTRGEPPDWLGQFNTRQSIDALHDAKWLAVGAPADAPALRTLTYDPAHPSDFTALYKASPFAVQAQFELLNELFARERLGQTANFDLVCLLASSSARLGYETGSRSPLLQQMLLQFDRQLEALMGQMSRTLGQNGFNLVVAGGHGAPPAPSPERRGIVAVAGESVADAVERALVSASLGHVERYIYPFLYLDTAGFRDPEPVRAAAARAALAHPAVAGYYTAGDACSVHDGWEQRFRNSFHPRRSGDVMLSYRPEFVEDYGQGRGISYGSLYNYDARVPLCFYGPQFRAGVFDAMVESVDLAPTLARTIGVPPPSSATGRVLAEALAE
jgi:hypothetical protein